MEELNIKETFIDRDVSYVEHEWVARRMQSRDEMAMAGSYVGASRKRRESRACVPGGGGG